MWGRVANPEYWDIYTKDDLDVKHSFLRRTLERYDSTPCEAVGGFLKVARGRGRCLPPRPLSSVLRGCTRCVMKTWHIKFFVRSARWLFPTSKDPV